MKPENSTSRPHIFEIDLIRAITVLTVVAVHSLAYTSYLTTKQSSLVFLSFIEHSLHYNREMFMFVTGLVLTYVYLHKEFSAKRFWLKRFSLVFIPYVLWSALYTVINNHGLGLLDYIKLSLVNILTGNASFQLYYILLALEFYALFPLFLTLIKRIVKYPWITLFSSFLLQIVFIYFDFHYLQTGPLSKLTFVNSFIYYQDRVILLYQFFFILGAFAAIYMDRVRASLRKSGLLLTFVFLAGIISYAAYYYTQIEKYGYSIDRATTVLQPSVVLYSLVVIIFVSWLAILWASKRRLYKLVGTISDTSFGIYFVHVLVLTYVIQLLLPIYSHFLPVAAIDLITIFFAFSISLVVCFLLLKIPIFSWTIGRARPVGNPVTAIKIFAGKISERRHRTRSALGWLLIVIAFFSIAAVISTKPFPPTTNSEDHPIKEEVARTVQNLITLPQASVYSANRIIDRPLRSNGCGKTLNVPAGKTVTVGIWSDGLYRDFRIYLPKEFSNRTFTPLVVSFHGYGSNAKEQERLTQFDRLADKYNFIVVYPDGTPGTGSTRGWNTGLHRKITTDDVLFTSNLLNLLQSNICIDSRRIYVSGFSNGGGLVNELTCSMANRIAAFAPVSGSYITSHKSCTAGPISIIEFHGTADRTVPYNGNWKRKEYSVSSWIQQMAKENKCAAKSQIIYNVENVIGYSIKKCNDNASIVHYKIVGEHHIWPTVLLSTKIDGEKREVNVAEIIWLFFEKHPLSGGI